VGANLYCFGLGYIGEKARDVKRAQAKSSKGICQTIEFHEKRGPLRN